MHPVLDDRSSKGSPVLGNRVFVTALISTSIVLTRQFICSMKKECRPVKLVCSRFGHGTDHSSPGPSLRDIIAIGHNFKLTDSFHRYKERTAIGGPTWSRTFRRHTIYRVGRGRIQLPGKVTTRTKRGKIYQCGKISSIYRKGLKTFTGNWCSLSQHIYLFLHAIGHHINFTDICGFFFHFKINP